MALWKNTVQVATAGTFTTGHMTPVRTNDANAFFNEGEEGSFHVLIDAQHLSAINSGRQVASQFGHGKYSVDVFIWPRQSILDSWGIGDGGDAAGRSEVALGRLKCKYVMPSKARYAALHHLKSLEKKNNDTMMNVDNFDGEAHPLLVADVDTDDPMSPGSGVGSTMSGHKGAKVIRFSFDNTVPVYGQDAYHADLDGDGNVTDNHESKYYTLLSDSAATFGILPRYEASINPVWNESGDTTVNLEWDKPLSMYKAYGFSEQQVQFGWNFNPMLPLNDGPSPIARFNNIEALGGLIKLEIPFFNSYDTDSVWDFLASGTNNNDFEMYVTVTCHSWTKMKR